MSGMTQEQMRSIMENVFEECRELRGAGQLEYAHKNENAFANFERAGKDLDLPREKVLWVFAMKHRDGIASYLKGHTSQREDVRGRINDLIVYLVLLRGMIEDQANALTPHGEALEAREVGGIIRLGKGETMLLGLPNAEY